MYELVKIASAQEIVRILSKMPDVEKGLSKRVDVGAYVDKLARLADNFVLLDGNEGKAFVSVYANDANTATAYISLIACVEGERNKGYGGYMFSYACSYAAAQGMKKMKLEVDYDNHNAIAFYQKHGMQKVAQTHHGYIMEKNL